MQSVQALQSTTIVEWHSGNCVPFKTNRQQMSDVSKFIFSNSFSEEILSELPSQHVANSYSQFCELTDIKRIYIHLLKECAYTRRGRTLSMTKVLLFTLPDNYIPSN